MRIMIKKVENYKNLNDFINSSAVIWVIDIYFNCNNLFVIFLRI